MRGWLPKHQVSSPSPLLFKCRERPWLRAHSQLSLRLEPLLSEPSPIMSSFNGFTIGGDKIPEGSKKEAKALEMTPPASRKHGRPKESRNKKTLEALTAVATVAPSTYAVTQAARAPGDMGISEKWVLAIRREAGGKPRPQRQPLLRRPTTADGHRAARTKRPLLPAGPLPPTLRGPV
jgi:hypothetical protein